MVYWTDLTAVFFLSIAVASVAMTLAKSQIFERPRYWVERKNRFLGELVSCPYCVSHWVALVAVIVYRPTPVSSGLSWGSLIVDYTVSLFMIVTISGGMIGLLFKAFKGE